MSHSHPELRGYRELRGEASPIERLLDLRDPLCRAELAASRITRDAWSDPEELALEIRSALRELDARIDTLVTGLRTASATDRSASNANSIILDLLRRMRPVLMTSGVNAEWRPPAREFCDAFEDIEPSMLRSAVLVVLRVAIASLPGGGRILLEAVTSSPNGLPQFAPAPLEDRDPQDARDSQQRFALRLRRFPSARRESAPEIGMPPTAATRATLEALRDTAADLGGWLDVRVDPDSALPSLYLWIGRASERVVPRESDDER